MLANCMNLFEGGLDLVPDQINVDFNSDFSGDRINLENWERAYCVISKPAGTAGDDLALAFQQHTAATSGQSKALTFTKWWYKKGTMSSQGTWTAVEEATPTSDLDTGTPTDYAFDTSAAVIIVEIRSDSLDGANGYTFVSYENEGDDFSNAMLGTVSWLMAGNRYPQAIPLSSLA